MQPIVNNLLQALPVDISQRLIQTCVPVDLEFGEVLYNANTPIRWVYFPLKAMVSFVTVLGDHPPLEMNLIGNEGMVGATITLGVSTSPMQAIVQGTGSALRMTAMQLMNEVNLTAILQRRIHRYLYVLMAQLARTAACTHFHEIEPRLARWLLMTHDRAHSDCFSLTQEFLSNMLGVRRSGVTIAAGELQNRKLIHYSRGEIHILDRIGLEAAACECYLDMKNKYQYIYE